MLLTVFTGGGLITVALGAGRKALWIAVIGIVASLLIHPSYLAVLWLADNVLTSEQTLWFGFQIVLMLAALLVALFVLFKRFPRTWVYASAESIIVAELLGRVAFYNM